jgi:sugar lactone lactonase YvrE
MNHALRMLGVVVILLGGWGARPRLADAGQVDTSAARVFGQPDFSSNAANNGGLSAHSLSFPSHVALDAQGNLYVADHSNNRVLEYDAPLTAGATADRVFGQPNFSSNTPDNGGITASSLDSPYGVAVDKQGNLYVADYNNSRVLEYDAPLSSSEAASHVFGQPNFSDHSVNTGGLSASTLNFPVGVAVDSQGNLFVADTNNSRVLEYESPLTTDAVADRVFGQADFFHNTPNSPSLSGASLSYPWGVTVDKLGNLYVADNNNNRVLEYDAPLSTGAAANRVFGQPDFAHNAGGLSATGLANPFSVAVDGAGNLFVGDYNNNRALEYDAPLSSGAAASLVFGQPDFTHNLANNGGVSTRSLWQPDGVAVDSEGSLYVADVSNNRVLQYDWFVVKIYVPLAVRS